MKPLPMPTGPTITRQTLIPGTLLDNKTPFLCNHRIPLRQILTHLRWTTGTFLTASQMLQQQKSQSLKRGRHYQNPLKAMIQVTAPTTMARYNPNSNLPGTTWILSQHQTPIRGAPRATPIRERPPLPG